MNWWTVLMTGWRVSQCGLIDQLHTRVHVGFCAVWSADGPTSSSLYRSISNVKARCKEIRECMLFVIFAMINSLWVNNLIPPIIIVEWEGKASLSSSKRCNVSLLKMASYAKQPNLWLPRKQRCVWCPSCCVSLVKFSSVIIIGYWLVGMPYKTELHFLVEH